MNSAKQHEIPAYQDVEDASRRIAGLVLETPLVESAEVNKRLGCRLVCKCEHLQEIGAFKIRGATNAIRRLRERSISSDVATHSSGNHGAAVAAAARQDGRKAVVVMPENSVGAKVRNVEHFGGTVVFCANTQQAREDGLKHWVRQGLVPVHPYDHFDIIAGQGTAALELLRQRPGLDTLLTPVGGGGLLAGTAIAASAPGQNLKIYAAEPAGAADTAESMRLGRRVTEWQPDTMADGLRALVGELPFRIIHERVHQVLRVSEAGILQGMGLFLQHFGVLIEPSSATVIAAILEHPEVFAERHVGAIITGGNVERRSFPQFDTTTDA